MILPSSLLAAFLAALGVLSLHPTETLAANGDLQAARLRCEYRSEPLGVDNVRPNLSWIVTSDLQGQAQTAYRVLVASSLENLNSHQGDLWDSSKTPGDTTYGIVYSGADLQSHQQCYWKVMSWDRDGKPGAWSKPAHWSIGILDPSEWKGEWIGYDAMRHLNSHPPAAPLDDAQWICFPSDTGEEAPQEQRLFFQAWELPHDLKIERATLTAIVDDTATILLNGVEVTDISSLSKPTTEEVGPYLRAGRNTVRIRTRNTGGPTGIAIKLTVTGPHGEKHVLTTDEQWLSLKENDSDWRLRSFEEAPQAHAIGAFGCKPWGKRIIHRDVSAPPSYMRGEFTISQPVRQATVYLASLGLADLSLNGTRVNKDYFSSGWTDYKKRVYYRAYEVTGSIIQGENVWGGVLADGWYSGHIAWGAQRDFYGKKPRFRAMLRVEYEDGTHDTFATNPEWTVTKGPRQLADFLVGEEYDATAEVPDWDKAGAAPVTVASVDVGTEVSPTIEWHPGPHVVEVEEFPAKSVSEPLPGVYVYDIGQNMAGIARIKVTAPKGRRIQIRYAERLNPDGTLYTTNLRLARAIDAYSCKGDGEEIWQARQTFHGFQYVELIGLDEQPPLMP